MAMKYYNATQAFRTTNPTKAYYDENGNAIPDDWANAISNQINVGR